MASAAGFFLTLQRHPERTGHITRLQVEVFCKWLAKQRWAKWRDIYTPYMYVYVRYVQNPHDSFQTHHSAVSLQESKPFVVDILAHNLPILNVTREAHAFRVFRPSSNVSRGHLFLSFTSHCILSPLLRNGLIMLFEFVNGGKNLNY